jgi:anti-anti-sigma factor
MELHVDSDDSPIARVSITGIIRRGDEDAQGDPLLSLLGDSPYSRPVLLDLSQVEMLNSLGIGWLITCHKRFREQGGRLVLHSVAPMAANVLRLMRMDTIFEVADSEEAALQKVQGKN